MQNKNRPNAKHPNGQTKESTSARHSTIPTQNQRILSALQSGQSLTAYDMHQMGITERFNSLRFKGIKNSLQPRRLSRPNPNPKRAVQQRNMVASRPDDMFCPLYQLGL